jgi:arylsulfatase A-like enzyme
MIVRWPGHVPAGRVSNTHWNPMDFAPTALDIAYALPTANANFKGLSVLPALLGQLGTNTGAIPERADRP